MRHDQAPGAHQWTEPAQVIEVALLVGVEEKQVDGALELRCLDVSVAEHQGGKRQQPGAVEVAARDLVAAAVGLEGGEPTAGPAECEQQPQPRVARRSAQFHHVPGARGLGQEAQQAAVFLRDAQVPVVAVDVLEYREHAAFLGRSGERWTGGGAAPALRE